MSLTRRVLGATVRGTTTLALLTVGCCSSASAVTLFDGFGDADRNNDGAITFYDTDINLSETYNMGGAGEPDESINTRGIIEVTAAEDASDTGIIWSATRGFTSSNTGDPKANLKIINDSVATGAETVDQIHNSGLALSYEAKGTGSSMIGNFGQSIQLGASPGSKIVASIDFRFWRESTNATGAPNPGQLRWGLFQDTDGQLGQSANEGLDDGSGQASVVWGEEDGDWRSSDPGPAGDRGIWARIPLGPAGDPADTRIIYEFNADIDGSNNNRFLEGGGVGGTGSNRDTGTIASPTSDGPGGSVAALGTHNLSLEVMRTASSIEVATFIDGVELLRDDIKDTDSFFPFLGAGPESFDYVAFRNASGDTDYVFDNFMIQTIVPEPSSVLLMVFGSALCVSARRHR